MEAAAYTQPKSKDPFMPIGRLMVKVDNHYLIATRNIHAGQFHNYFAAGVSDGKHQRKFYMIMPDNGKPVALYENEVTLL